MAAGHPLAGPRAAPAGRGSLGDQHRPGRIERDLLAVEIVGRFLSGSEGELAEFQGLLPDQGDEGLFVVHGGRSPRRNHTGWSTHCSGAGGRREGTGGWKSPRTASGGAKRKASYFPSSNNSPTARSICAARWARAGGEGLAERAPPVVELQVRQAAADSVGLERLRTGAVAVDEVLQHRALTIQEILHRGFVIRVVKAEGNNRQPATGQPMLEIDRMGKPPHARLAPGGPEIHQHHLAAVLGQHIAEAGRIDRPQRHALRRRRRRRGGASDRQENE